MLCRSVPTRMRDKLLVPNMTNEMMGSHSHCMHNAKALAARGGLPYNPMQPEAMVSPRPVRLFI